jgi:hypothetical protein
MANHFVRLRNGLPQIAAALPNITQQWVNTEALRLAGDLRAAVDPDALAAPAIQEGIYVRTPTWSGYDDAARRVEALFAGDLSKLFARALPDLFAPTLPALFAPTLQALLDPKILPEVDAPPPGMAKVACVTEWGGIAEHGRQAKPFWWKTVREYEPDGEGLARKLKEVIT